MWRLTSALLRIKSNCRVRFSAFVGSQLWERIIHCEIRCGAQPFPKQNIISLNVSLSPIGFAQNILWYSSGHHFKGKNASPLIIWNSSLRSAIISCLESKRNLLRYASRVAMFKKRPVNLNFYLLLNLTVVCHLLRCQRIISPSLLC